MDTFPYHNKEAVYIFENVEAQRVKVGMTINQPADRLRSINDMWTQLNNLCQIVAHQLNPSLSIEALDKISGCYALQKTYQFDEFSQRHITLVMNNLLEQSQNDSGDET